MSTLWSDFLTHHPRPMQKWSQYFPAYEQHFSRYVGTPVTMWEIGVADGGSVEMWKRYFGPAAQIVGIDIAESCKQFEDDQVAIRIGDQSDPHFLQQVVSEFGHPDILLDDGSHLMHHVYSTFKFMYPNISRSGVYAVEDMHTAYYPHMGGGLREPSSFIEFSKNAIDLLNADHHNGPTGQPSTDPFTRSTTSIHFYDSMVVFERAPRKPNRNIQFGY